MRIQISLSAKSLGDLYHATDKRALLKILRSGKLAMSTGRAITAENKLQGQKNFFASFTRSRFGGYHFNEGGHPSIYGDTKVLITLDGTALSNREKIVPVDYWQHRKETADWAQRGKEFEERLVSDKAEVPILKYIKRVDLIQAAVHGKVQTYGAEQGKFSVEENDRFQMLLGSIVLQLKKHKIPYSFYNSVADWSYKRSPYTYTGPKDIAPITERVGRSSYSFKDMSALIEALSDKPYEKLSEKARKICSQMYTYPNDIASVLNDYENYRKPDASPIFRNLALKIARMLKRLNLGSHLEVQKYLANKADVHYKAERKRDEEERADMAAPLIIAALTLPIDEWPSHKNAWLNPKSVFGEIKDRWGYMYDEAERFVTKTLETNSTEVDKLRAVMRKLDLPDASSVVSSIYYDKVKPRLQEQGL